MLSAFAEAHISCDSIIIIGLKCEHWMLQTVSTKLSLVNKETDLALPPALPWWTQLKMGHLDGAAPHPRRRDRHLHPHARWEFLELGEECDAQFDARLMDDAGSHCIGDLSAEVVPLDGEPLGAIGREALVQGVEHGGEVPEVGHEPRKKAYASCWCLLPPSSFSIKNTMDGFREWICRDTSASSQSLPSWELLGAASDGD